MKPGRVRTRRTDIPVPAGVRVAAAGWRRDAAPAIRDLWRRHGTAVLLAAIASMMAVALWRLGNELPRLLWETGGLGAFDLQLRHQEVQRWFSGLTVYGPVQRGDYPPASYAILWPLLGWLDIPAARALWAATTVASMAWLARIAARESTSSYRLHVLLMMLLPFSTYAASAAIRVGQVGNHVIPMLVAGLLLLHRGRGRWWEDAFAAGLLIPALVKPILTVPFFWLACFVPGRLRPIILVSVGYMLVTLFAASFQAGDPASILLGWLGERPQALQGHANIHKWLALAGLRDWMIPATAAILLALGVWVHRFREADVWILLGVSALVARFFVHHRLYDDMLVLLPMITLFRIAHMGPREGGGDVAAGLLFAAMWLTLHAPASLLQYPAPVSTFMEAGQTGVWLVALVFLLYRARRAPVARQCDPNPEAECLAVSRTD